MSMLFKLNLDQAARDKIIFGATVDLIPSGGIRLFDDLSLTALSQLLSNKFIDPEETQNCSPTVAEIHAFMSLLPGMMAIGYTVGREREDYRVSLDGVRYEGCLPRSCVNKIVDFIHGSDELFFDVDTGFRAWWD
jgi:hypothetical protein